MAGEDARPGVSWDRVYSVAGNIVAPATALSALLFYFGYVSTRAQYLYFGLDVDTIGLSTQSFVMRSPGPLLVPLLVLVLLVAAALALNRWLAPRLRQRAPVALGSGLGLLGAGLVLLFAYTIVGRWPYYPLATPALMALGGTVTAYVLGLGGGSVRLRVALWITVAAAVFWANATLAQWSGTGLAQEQAGHLEDLPRVVVDTRERLYLRSPDITETRLPFEEGQTFRYRYRGLRLLVQNGDRMFLVPCNEQVSPCPHRRGSATLLVRWNDSTRLQFLAP
ncbi:hypothetical protein ABEG17_17275 [Pedococcus sp. KACC 23699]|uniref:Uncharacterized protein n=1 Tax=Pedococcus sp. KACC 23699 TaxID=3149228 RepID=A0AAU7JSD1_9MICO